MRSLFTGRFRFLGYLAALGVVVTILSLAWRSFEKGELWLWALLILDPALTLRFALEAVGRWEQVARARKSGFASFLDAIRSWIAIGWGVMWLIAVTAGTILGIVLFFCLLSDLIFGWPHFQPG
ncbi:MAG: hypothetical protein H0U98_07465 [Alphaproteobacteria bacterium]|nr:hypothetical protein [Alphaproteobacteria bacterium]